MKKYIIQFISVFLFAISVTAQSDCYEPDASIWLNPWLSCRTSAHPIDIYDQEHWIQYDFGKVRSLSKTWIWNVNDPSRLSAGFNEVSIHHSQDGVRWTHWGDMMFPVGTGDAIYSGFSGPDLLGVDARFVVLTGVSNHGNPSCSGLSEVKFNLFNKVDGSYRDIFDAEVDDMDEDAVAECPTIIDVDVEYLPNDEAVYFTWDISGQTSDELFYAFFFGVADSDDWEEVEIDEAMIYIEDIERGVEYEYMIEVLCEDDYTTTDVKYFLADASTSTNDAHVELDDSGVSILPNPAADYFMIKGDMLNYDIEILNIEGQVMSSLNNVNQEQRIDISSLGVGMYFVKIKHQTNKSIDVQLMIKAE